MDAMRIVAAVASIFFSASASAEIYKCKNAQGKTEYSDMPCAGATGTGIQNSPVISNSDDPNARALSIYIREALEQRDFNRAKSLATTPEHVEMIRVAEDEDSRRRKERFDRAMKVETLKALHRGNAINQANGDKLEESNRIQEETNRDIKDLKNKQTHCRTLINGRVADTRCD